MPICSYVVHPAPGRMLRLMESLSTIQGCEVTPAVNHELLLLVTETENAVEEKILQDTLNTLENVECLAMAFGDIPASPIMETENE